MMQSVKVLLENSKKKSFLRQAYLYSQLNFIRTQILIGLYPNFIEEFESCSLYYREYNNLLEIKLMSTNFSFLSWMKTECESIKTTIANHLESKGLIDKNQKIVLKCMGK